MLKALSICGKRTTRRWMMFFSWVSGFNF